MASVIENLDDIILQVTLKEKLFGTGSGNLTELENMINKQDRKDYRLHTITTSNGEVKDLWITNGFKRFWCLKEWFSSWNQKR